MPKTSPSPGPCFCRPLISTTRADAFFILLGLPIRGQRTVLQGGLGLDGRNQSIA